MLFDEPRRQHFTNHIKFQSLTNLPCGLESNNNIATAGVSMDEEDGSADDDEHIRTGRSNDDDYDDNNVVSTSFAGPSEATAGKALINGTRNGGAGGGGSGTGIEKFRIDYPKKFHNARSMSLSMERNAYCELCRFSRSPVPFDRGGGSGDGGEPDDRDKGVRRYFGFTIKQYMALGSLALVDFLGFCSMSVMAPTFPKEAEKKDMTVSEAGLVFSFFALIMFLLSPAMGSIMPIFGTKCLFISGVFISGVCNMLFGLLPMVQDNFQFKILCFIVRGLEAIGASAFSTSSFVYVIQLFPENVSSVLGILETFVGLGMSVGPAIGGLLSSVGGYAMPFFVVGLLMVATVPLHIYLMPPIRDDVKASQAVGSRSKGIIKLLIIPSAFVVGAVITVTSNFWASLDPTLEPHLREMGLSTHEVGLVFLFCSILYGVSSPFWGYIADKYNNHWSMMAVGLFSSAIGLFILAPLPWFPVNQDILWLNLVGLGILGVSASLTMMPAFNFILSSAIENGFQESVSTFGTVAGFWSSAYSLGDMTGPSLGGVLLQHFGFSICMTTMGLFCLVVGVITIGFFGLIKKKKKRPRTMSDKSPLNDPRIIHPRYNSLNDDRGRSMLISNFSTKTETTEV
ncbi:MFS-type transporter SLC18B1-like isoform X2 [Rhopalosiphum padi]|uniref:MFS-type transporter SLC18B1-like isoform X2 n=1 Tax=Rhopalosiphum padi TaxID=40932 RepID=UPI00298E72EE|nr:MFS-type transporter SLC18B1-like isoform X2 [Rhopalosiphum padi]